MAAVVREIDRKYDLPAGRTAALDAVQPAATVMKPQRALVGRLPAAAVAAASPLTRGSTAFTAAAFLALGLLASLSLGRGNAFYQAQDPDA